ncbi:2-hydroxy-3-keto-5-methylthiopentenyl-1-phosphate phosphatase [Bacillus sp. ISL-35]|uniref:2-hydroxy-3-keto-5-methylthiopentenyl-1- phosphate phosphatase n=1 Tax=Bacillus sp. ISL-35 TaxID=2819122 RepID=UPI001BE745B1|nr:2-hydroxy-3-keto-5-methylthiopentenyl-1-phosphate phosphatase [Bacillus sp. ISL-35]MBT2678340.1 2-hydroxy-3-keto-5-methylthiopentenyl-1-phosphate phosphatase [Bacillus sp. ISL-35]MBT2705936.1 2-hydroxy-3-keto-5-methylthiopentenyl-1-phosphate phosphatase [Chryseobacterium sp. ISL-80]
MSQPVIFCDFDGTVTEKDNIIAIMNRFAPEGWEELKEGVLNRTISIREGVGKMFSLLPVSLKDEIIEFAVKNARIRPGFQEFLDFAKEEGIPVYIVSGGIDFFIEPIIKSFGPIEGIFCNGSDLSGESIKIEWPNSCDDQCSNDCGCCKPSIMRNLGHDGIYKIVIGDSVTDLEAAKQADYVFARDYLKDKCEEWKIPYTPFETFHDCIEALKIQTGVRG